MRFICCLPILNAQVLSDSEYFSKATDISGDEGREALHTPFVSVFSNILRSVYRVTYIKMLLACPV